MWEKFLSMLPSMDYAISFVDFIQFALIFILTLGFYGVVNTIKGFKIYVSKHTFIQDVIERINKLQIKK